MAEKDSTAAEVAKVMAAGLEKTEKRLVIIEYPEGDKIDEAKFPRLPEHRLEEIVKDFEERGCTVHKVPSTRFHITMTDFDRHLTYPLVYPAQPVFNRY